MASDTCWLTLGITDSFAVIMVDNNWISTKHLDPVVILATSRALGGVGSAAPAIPQIESNRSTGPGEGSRPEQSPPLEYISAAGGLEVLICVKNKLNINLTSGCHNEQLHAFVLIERKGKFVGKHIKHRRLRMDSKAGL